LNGKHILIGITAGIAAYKVALLIRMFKENGAQVKCVMTPKSCDFISPLVVSTLSENPVGIEFWNKENGTWTNHVEYALWADVFVVAPCTATTLAKMVNGQADNLLLAVYLSMKTKAVIAPAMDLDMYAHPTTKRNLQQISKDGVCVIEAESGFLASGLHGKGRMAEPSIIFEIVSLELQKSYELKGKKILVTAGPTHEMIDPVRMITNKSSGKMGFAIAKQLAQQGAEVFLITGAKQIEINHPKIHVIKIVTAQELFTQVKKYWTEMNAGIFCAAVSDYAPEYIADQKIKKQESTLTLKLVKTPDSLLWAGQNKTQDQILIGFALETENIYKHATEKLTKKNLNFIVVNSPKDGETGFDTDTNQVFILDNHNKTTHFELKTKQQVAQDIITYYKNYQP